MDKNYFEQLNAVNVSDRTEKKNGLTYLSWSWAWGELKKRYPLSYYTVYEDTRGLNYFTDGKTAYVKTGVTVVDGEIRIEHIEYLPVMDFRNQSIPLEKLTSFDVNKAIQRSLTKAVARHGLGLYIYSGEDLPEEETVPENPKKAVPVAPQLKPDKTAPQPKKAPESTEPLTKEEAEILLSAFEARHGKCERGTEACEKLKALVAGFGVKKLGEIPHACYADAVARIADV